MTDILHFTISPVQTFIGQSRRTRDLWSSSFLLSWLSGIAMAEVLNAPGGKILFPSVQDVQGEITDDLLRAILGKDNKSPFIGSLPNRFKAEVPATFNPAVCVNAVQAKWIALAKEVKDHFLPLTKLATVFVDNQPVLHIPAKARKNPNSDKKSLTETLWDQQVRNFWDIQWIKGKAPGESKDARWLDLRKNWRQHVQPDQQEPGDACTLMPGWVELSGHVRSLHKDRQDAFWETLRAHLPGAHHGGDHDTPEGANNPGVGNLNLRDDERLCAIAFIKRLWPKLPRCSIEKTLGWVPDRITKSAGNWPSTAYMAALPWVKATYTTNDAQQKMRCDDYVESLQTALARGSGQREGLFSEKLSQIAGIDPREYFCTLDGQLFYEDGLQAAAKEGLLAKDNIKALQQQLSQIAPQTKASPFYAVLRMDGDSVGKLIGEAGHATRVSKALAGFASQVRSVVDTAHSGATLYAGGDDVLALLPLNNAIPCAKAIQHAYQTEMQKEGLRGTISAAIVFAHFHLPLSFVMAESGRLLDDVAKTQNGRNSLAVAVHKPGGLHLEWTSRWDSAKAARAADADAHPAQATNLQPVQTLLDLATQFNAGHGGKSQKLPLSSGFLYRIRERWGDLATRNDTGQPVLQFSQTHVQQLWAADLLANRDLGDITDKTRDQAKQLAAQLFAISRDNKNNPNHAAPPGPPPDSGVVQPNPLFSESGGLLVRFLATKGVQL